MKMVLHWFVPELEIGSDFRIRGMAVQQPMGPCIVNRPAGTGDYLFMFFHDGTVVNRSGSRVAPNSFRVWTPDKGHYYGNPDFPWNHSWIHCYGGFVERKLKASGIPVNKMVFFPYPGIVDESLLELYREVFNKVPERIIVRNLFENFLMRMARALRSSVLEKQIPERFREIRHFIEREYAEKLSLADLAVRIHVSVPHFCGEFKRYHGISPIEFLIATRMQNALHHLKNVNYSILDVAQKVGYDDIYHFSRIFKKRFGISPRAMRKKMLNAN